MPIHFKRRLLIMIASCDNLNTFFFFKLSTGDFSETGLELSLEVDRIFFEGYLDFERFVLDLLNFGRESSPYVDM